MRQSRREEAGTAEGPLRDASARLVWRVKPRKLECGFSCPLGCADETETNENKSMGAAVVQGFLQSRIGAGEGTALRRQLKERRKDGARCVE